MKSLNFTSFFLTFITCILFSLVPTSLQYASIDSINSGNGEPTATLSLVRDPEDPSNRYSLQVSTDQINHYLKTLSNVPSSIYDGAHIITDFDESALSTAYSRPSSESNGQQQQQQDSNKYSLEEPSHIRNMEKANLYHESNYGSESNLFPKKQMTLKLFDEMDFGLGRMTANEKALRRMYLANRDFIIRKDEQSQVQAAVAAANKENSPVKQATSDSSESVPSKVASASTRVTSISEVKPSSIEIGQKPALNEYPPSLPSSIRGHSTFGLPRDLVSKEKSEADLEREKEEQAAMEKVQDDLMKELFAIQKQSRPQQGQSNEQANIVKDQEIVPSSSKDSISQASLVQAKNEVDLKTVQSLLTTLIKQIEQIQQVAKNLPLGGQTQSTNEEPVRMVEGSKIYKETHNIEGPVIHEIRGKRIELHGEGRRKVHKKSHKNPEEHQEVFLKAPDLVKLLTGESFDPEYLPAPTATVARRIVPMPMTLPSYHIPRSTPAYPFAYSMPFSNIPLASFYPGKFLLQNISYK